MSAPADLTLRGVPSVATVPRLADIGGKAWLADAPSSGWVIAALAVVAVVVVAGTLMLLGAAAGGHHA